MAKKSFSDPDDLLSGLDDLVSPRVGRSQSQSARSRSKTFIPEPAADARDIAIATADKSMAGQYKRKQILIPPDQLIYIRKKAKEIGVSQAELFRWLIDYGLTALDRGIKPEIEVVDVRGETIKAHWTSQPKG
jgi:hypothetical protein